MNLNEHQNVIQDCGPYENMSGKEDGITLN